MFKKNTKILLIIILFFINTSVYWNTGDFIVEENIDLNSAQTNTLSTNENRNPIKIIVDTNNKDLTPQSQLTEQVNTNSIENDIADKKKQLNSIFDPTKQEKDIKNIENIIKEVQIKRDINNEFLDSIKNEVNNIKENISKNEENLKIIGEENKKTADWKIKINELERTIRTLKNQLTYKEIIFSKLQSKSDDYEILQLEYENNLKEYTKLKNQSDKAKSIEIAKKMKLLYVFLILSLIIYISKVLILKVFKNKYESKILYFDFVFALVIICFLIGFFFYIYTEMYVLLFFISWYLVYINAPIIASFIWSILVFRKYTIWDIIKQWEDKWKIVRISPMFTTIRVMNDDWIITNHNINIPNAILVREKVDVIKNPNIMDHNFHIILNLKEIDNLFKIIDEIKDNIILKTLTCKLNNIDLLDEDIFKVTYDQTDTNKVKINFFWRSTSKISMKLERKILWYIKYQVDLIEQRKKDLKQEEEKGEDNDDEDEDSDK